MTAAAVRKPRYHYHDTRPAGGIYLTEWAIERQLSLASDYGEADLVDVLRAMNPDLDATIGTDIETLLDLGDEVAAWERDDAIDLYCDHLRKLAQLVRGATTRPTRERHVLGEVSS